MKKRITFAVLVMIGLMVLPACNTFIPFGQTSSAPAYVEGGLTFTTGGEQGTYYRFGQALARVISEKTDTALNTVVSGGSQDNINSVQSGSAMVGFAQTDVLSYAYEGTRLFDSKADRISLIAELYKEQVQIITLDPGIRSVDDLKGKSVSIGAPGSGVYFNAIDVLAAYGLDEHDINPTYQSFSDSMNDLKSRKLDAAFVVAGAPTSAVSGLAATENIYMISLDEDHINRLIASSPFYSKGTVGKAVYNTSADINTVAVGAVLVANDEASEEDIYNIISGIYENKEAVSRIHSKGAELDLQTASEITSVPYHPGAAKYYAEKGISVAVK